MREYDDIITELICIAEQLCILSLVSTEAQKVDRVLSVVECYELIRYRKILTPDQRELMERHEEWLRESYEAEQMDRQRENWLFNRKL